MSIARRWKNRLLWTVCVLVAAAPLAGVADTARDCPTPPAVSTPPTQTAGFIPEVRIRKLHLVRPDLIPYPIAYEIVC